MKSLNGRHRKQTAVHNSAFMSTFDEPDVVHEVSHSFETHGWAEVDRRKRQASCTYMKVCGDGRESAAPSDFRQVNRQNQHCQDQSQAHRCWQQTNAEKKNEMRRNNAGKPTNAKKKCGQTSERKDKCDKKTRTNE
ncbi:hypothetical protein EV424DRAFT_1343224 [Suillus variegatus]|nr:hypothetical protein EV424DRAFT_1343224 [Suillus variegatus]